MRKQSTQEKMAADDKIIAFDFQFHYFLLKCFSLKINESAGFEVKEDVHIDHANGKSTYIQVKHTAINQNITNKDEALWKTLWSWLNIIKDGEEDREIISKQLEFISNTTFILLTNKHDKENNLVFKILSEYRNKKVSLDKVITCINSLVKKGKDHSKIDEKILELVNQDKKLLEVFFKKIKFTTDFMDIDQQIRARLTEIYVPKELQSGMIEAIYYKLRIELYNAVLRKEHLSYSQKKFSELVNKYNGAPYLRRIAVYKNFDVLGETKPSSDMLFIKQLEDIEELDLSNPEDEGYTLKLYENKLLYETNRMRWIQESELPELDINEIEDQAEEIWLDEFHRSYRKYKRGKMNEENVNDIARELFYEVKRTGLEFSMDISYSKKLGEGVFLYLSDMPTIGWHYDWKERHGDANL
ncbi:MAG: ABC-three component system protein [Carnobacterium sp.]|uniref:ABC-three component system protein n=1 Tax=Carnobacterium sp. TaxID=48221 RepID=UPI003315B42A